MPKRFMHGYGQPLRLCVIGQNKPSSVLEVSGVKLYVVKHNPNISRIQLRERWEPRKEVRLVDCAGYSIMHNSCVVLFQQTAIKATLDQSVVGAGDTDRHLLLDGEALLRVLDDS